MTITFNRSTISSKDFFDDACFSERRYYLKNLYCSVVKKPFIRRTAFTLAEVLVVLGIIGLIADMTIPTLINSYEKKIAVTRLQNTYALLEQTMRMANVDNGPVNDWDGPTEYTTDEAKKFAEKYIQPYVKYTKTCDNCTDYKVIAMNKEEFGVHSGYQVYLVNGVILSFFIGQKKWPNDPYPWAVLIEMDINGVKKPNRLGRDIFDARIQKDNEFVRLLGYGMTREEIMSADDTNNCNKAVIGSRCGGLIRMDGWRIADDYPW